MSSRARRFPVGREHILLAEDDEQVRLLVKTTLEKKGYTVTAAPSGIAAAAILASTNPKPINLLVADLLMPRDFSGLELSEHVRERYPTVRTLYMSGYPADKLPGGLILEPGAHFIHKPFSIQDLLTAVRRRLDEPSGPATGPSTRLFTGRRSRWSCSLIGRPANHSRMICHPRPSSRPLDSQIFAMQPIIACTSTQLTSHSFPEKADITSDPFVLPHDTQPLSTAVGRFLTKPFFLSGSPP